MNNKRQGRQLQQLKYLFLILCLSMSHAAFSQGCSVINSVPATPPSSGVLDSLVSSTAPGYYSADGTEIYNTYDVNGNGNPTMIPDSNLFWINYNSGPTGPLNRCGVWAASNPVSIGFSVCIDIAESKTYYMGFAADNTGTLTIDGNVVLQGLAFWYWGIYKINLSKGKHIVAFSVVNWGGPAALGFEIYDNTESQIINATSYSDLNLVFSTKNEIGKPVEQGAPENSYSCPIGYTLDYCAPGAPVCSQFLPVNLTITNPQPVCAAIGADITDSLITQGSSSGLTYTYWADSAAAVPITNPKKIMQSGTYYIKGTSNTGCSIVKPVAVTTKPTAVSTINAVICYGTNFLGYKQTGTYVDTLVATDGCDSIRTLNLVVIPPNTSSVSAAICPGFSYLGYSHTGTYTDTLLTAGGCDSIRSLNLVVNPVKYATLTTAICRGESYLGHNKSGIYIDTLNASDGCDSIRTINLTVNNNPKPDLGKNDIVCINDSLILSPGVFENYVWQDGSTGATFTVKNAGKYWVTVTDENGCTAADTIQIKKVYCSLVDIPNAFTPNGDGINDTWDIYALRFFPGCSVSVYSRWGRLVFKSLGYGKPWDGTSNGKQLPVGTYYYVINLNNGSPPLSGYVTIIR